MTYETDHYETVYLAGPLSDGDNSHRWHERVQSLVDFECINPFTIHPEGATGEEIHERDLEAVRESDALLLKYTNDYEVCGAYIEAGVAYENDIPTIVWNSDGSDVPEFLEWHAVTVDTQLNAAINTIRFFDAIESALND